MDGLAARMIRLPGWKPPVISSRSGKPDGVPVMVLPASPSGGELLDLVVEDVGDDAEVLAAVVVADLEDRALGVVEQVARVAGVGPTSCWISVGRGEEAADERGLLDDLAVLARVADDGRGGGERLDGGGAARGVELAGLLELLDDRQLVDRLALLVEARASRRR